MMRPTVGFYVHYHGLGHKHRTEAILKHLRYPAYVITSRLEKRSWRGPTLEKVIGLPCDIEGVPAWGRLRQGDVSALHHAPLWTPNITSRVAQYAQWLDRVQPAVMVVDVSAEISLLTRLAAVPQIVMRQHGNRSDTAHIAAYESAELLLAPFPQWMEDDITPGWVRAKTVYLDGFCRSAAAPRSRHANRSNLGLAPERRTVVCLFGKGGDGIPLARISEAARQTPDTLWLALGPSEPNTVSTLPANLRLVGWVDQPEPYLRAADVVVTAAGHNSVMECGSLGCSMIAIAEPRPFDEQRRKVRVLQREQLAVGLDQWPQPDAWPDLLDRAGALDVDRWKGVFATDGAQQAARQIHRVAKRSMRLRRKAAVAPTGRFGIDSSRTPKKRSA